MTSYSILVIEHDKTYYALLKPTRNQLIVVISHEKKKEVQTY
jgi:hypothetical protein